MNNTSPTPTLGPHPNRRSLLRAAAWAPPAVLLASAAPAFADSALSRALITTSDSYRGNLAEYRNLDANFFFNFTISPATGHSLSGTTTVTFTLGKNRANLQMHGVVLNIDISSDWSVSRTVNKTGHILGESAASHGVFTFTKTAAGSTPLNLHFRMLSFGYVNLSHDQNAPDTVGTVTIASTGKDSVTYDVYRENQGTSPTDWQVGQTAFRRS